MFPKHLQYTRDDLWLDVRNTVVTIGVTAYAARELMEILHLELPEENAPVRAGAPFGGAESVKAVVELTSPVTGTVIEVNEVVRENPVLIHESPYEAGWLIRVLLTELNLPADLLDYNAYDILRGD